MIIRNLKEIRASDRNVKADSWTSARMLLADDGMGFSFHMTTLRAAQSAVVAAVRGNERGGGQLQASRIVVSLDLNALLGGAFVLRKIRLERPILTVQNRLMGLSRADTATQRRLERAAWTSAESFEAICATEGP